MLPIVLRSHGWLVTRSAVYLAAALSMSAGLLAVLPVAAYYSDSAYSGASFGLEVDGVLDRGALARLERIAEPGTLASYALVEPAPMRSASGRVPGALVLLADRPGRVGASWFPESLVTARAAVTGSWVDVSTTLARDLGVGPGDEVVLSVGTDYRMRVRRLLAVEMPQSRDVAMTPRTARLDGLLPEIAGYSAVATLSTRADLAAVTAAATSTTGPGGKPLNGQPPTVRTRLGAAAQARIQAGVHGNGSRALLAIGIAAVLGLAIREGHALATTRLSTLATLAACGASRGALVGSLVGAEALAAAAVGLTVWLLLRDVTAPWLLGDAWPPQIDAALGVTLAGCLAGYLAAVGIVMRRRLAYDGLLDSVRTGASL